MPGVGVRLRVGGGGPPAWCHPDGHLLVRPRPRRDVRRRADCRYDGQRLSYLHCYSLISVLSCFLHCLLLLWFSGVCRCLSSLPLGCTKKYPFIVTQDLDCPLFPNREHLDQDIFISVIVPYISGVFSTTCAYTWTYVQYSLGLKWA